MPDHDQETGAEMVKEVPAVGVRWGGGERAAAVGGRTGGRARFRCVQDKIALNRSGQARRKICIDDDTGLRASATVESLPFQ